VHIHLIDFEILTRNGDNGSVLPYEAAGLKDVVYLGPGQYVALKKRFKEIMLIILRSIQVIARYAPWDGVYMFHCHNLVHEDNE
jgi:FtsP/CotA-like multicopper oxidase with cupredoxin domain